MFLNDLVRKDIYIEVETEEEWRSFRLFSERFFPSYAYIESPSYIRYDNYYPYKYFALYEDNKYEVSGRHDPAWTHGSSWLFEKITIKEAWEKVEEDIKAIENGAILIDEDGNVLTNVELDENSEGFLCIIKGIEVILIGEVRFFGEE